MTTPADVPFGFVAIPQYATERILREELAMLGDVEVDRSVPRGYGVRSMHQTDGVLVYIPCRASLMLLA